jgi:hypothetical protein
MTNNPAATYTVTPRPDGTFTVEIRYADGGAIGQQFRTEAEATAWASERRQMDSEQAAPGDSP